MTRHPGRIIDGMAKVHLSVTIDRPVSDVYDVLTTPELTPRWSASAIEEHMTTPGPPAVGSRRRATLRRMGGGTTENEIEIVELEPERRVAVRSLESIAPFTASWTFMPVGGGTRVDWDWDFQLTGPLRLLGPLVTWSFARSFQHDLERLRSMLEDREL